MPSETPRFTIRIDPELIRKIRYIAEECGRSANKEIEQLIKARISEYEKQNGAIPPEHL